jgi:hypothetical protein
VARSHHLHLNVPEHAETPRRESQHSAFCIIHSISTPLPDKGRSKVILMIHFHQFSSQDNHKCVFKSKQSCSVIEMNLLMLIKLTNLDSTLTQKEMEFIANLFKKINKPVSMESSMFHHSLSIQVHHSRLDSMFFLNRT